MVGVIHLALQLLARLPDVLLHLLPLLFLHLVQGLPALGVLELKRAAVGKPRRLLTLSVKEEKGEGVKNTSNNTSKTHSVPFNQKVVIESVRGVKSFKY